MSRRYWNTPYYSQPSTEELQRRAKASQEAADERGHLLEPVIIEGRNIATSWWGKAWCANLESYADYDTRLPRGKRYVKTGTVIDLKINEGNIQAKVQGNRKIPYTVKIYISTLNAKKCQPIIDRCSNKPETLDSLLKGDFPEEMKDLFLSKDGLFPSPNEISISCSCPDWAVLCKHAAAVLYGIGNRFDKDPMLFFTLRGIDVNRFIDVSLSNHVDNLLKNADKIGSHRLESEELDELFGFQIEHKN